VFVVGFFWSWLTLSLLLSRATQFILKYLSIEQQQQHRLSMGDQTVIDEQSVGMC
jgi:hypothetical protein